MKGDAAAKAKLLVVLLAFAWGFNWVAAAIALREVSPWSLRVAGSGIGAATLFLAAIITGYNLKVPRGEYIHIMVAGFLNVAAFQILSSFAQLSGATARAIIITYSMPIWTTVLSRLFLGERLNTVPWLAFTLCVVGLTILVWPLFAAGFPIFVFYSLGCAWSWAIATVYIKWARVTIEPLANAAWQLLFGFGAWCAIGGAQRLAGFMRSPVVLGLAAAYLLFALAIVMTWYFPRYSYLVPKWLSDWIYPIDKTNLDVLRFVHFLALAVLTVRFVARDWPVLKSPWLRPAILCGQHSLEIFCLGVFLAFAAHFIMVQVSEAVWAQVLASAIGIALMVAVAWLLSWYKNIEGRSPGSRPPDADLAGGEA